MPGAKRTRLAPSTGPASIWAKVTNWAALLVTHWGRSRDKDTFDWVFDDVARYDALLREYGSTPLSNAVVFEVGYGARPYRMMALHGLGINAAGIDAEAPVLQGRPRQFWRIFRTNGPERLAKSVVRHLLFDGPELRRFKRTMREHSARADFDPGRLQVGDATEVDLPVDSFDLIFSEDVFEHIAAERLDPLCARIAAGLTPGGLALISPNVYSGITGGHLVEWNRRSFTTAGARRRTPPWGHLRGNSKPPNTFLNRLTRADYRELFQRHFVIRDEQVKIPDLGREFLTAEVRQEVTGWSEDELFSNQVLFVLQAPPG
jgi:Methyltransferase domain